MEHPRTRAGRPPPGQTPRRRRSHFVPLSPPREPHSRRPQLHGHTRARLGRSRERGRQGRLSRHQAGHDPDAAPRIHRRDATERAGVPNGHRHLPSRGRRTAVRKRGPGRSHSRSPAPQGGPHPVLTAAYSRRVWVRVARRLLRRFQRQVRASRRRPRDDLARRRQRRRPLRRAAFLRRRRRTRASTVARVLAPRPRRRHRDPRFDDRRQGGGYVDRSGGRSAGLPRQARHRHEPGRTRRRDLGQG